MYITVDFKLSEEIQNEIKEQALKHAEDILTKDRTELNRLVRDCVKGALKANINDLIQSDEFRRYLRDRVMEDVGMLKKETRIPKYVELSLTGNIPVHPKFLYEYDVPEDMDEALEIVKYTDSNETNDFDVCLNRAGNKVVVCNTTPAVLKYYVKEK